MRFIQVIYFLFLVQLLNAQRDPFGYPLEYKLSHFNLRGAVRQVSHFTDTSNENARGSSVMTFNKHGLLTKRTRWRYEGQELPAIEHYSYYPNDSLKHILEIYNGKKTGMRQFLYSADKTYRLEYFFYRGTDYLVDSLLYNEFGDILRKYHFNHDRVTEHREYCYDVQGRLAQWIQVDDSGYIVLRHDYRYDADNNLIEDIQLGYLNDFEEKICYLYQSGKIKLIELETSRYRKQSFHEYDSTGNLKRVITYWDDDPLDGNLIEYTYDQKGNWITRKAIYNTEGKVKQYFYVRKIEYYEGD